MIAKLWKNEEKQLAMCMFQQQSSKKSCVKCAKRKRDRESLKEGSHEEWTKKRKKEEWGEIFAFDCLQTWITRSSNDTKVLLSQW